jgi:putative salt-induced outer membrane protein YdiY
MINRILSFSIIAIIPVFGTVAVSEEAAAAWAHEASLALTGKSGNSDKMDLASRLKSVRTTEASTTELYASYQYAKAKITVVDPATGDELGSIDEKSADEVIAGIKYNQKITESLGWYVRDELERDPFEAIDLRNTVAGGFSYLAYDTGKSMLRFNGGFSHRYEAYEDDTSESLVGLDFGLQHKIELGTFAVATTNLTYTPAFEDMGNFRASHRTDVDVPLGGTQSWKLRLSLDNQYSSQPTGLQKKLDTTYQISLLLSWK